MNKERNIIIVCEDTYGLDVFSMIEAINTHALRDGVIRYRVLGFLHERPDSWKGLTPPAPVLGSVSDWTCDLKTSYVMAIRVPDQKRIAADILKKCGAQFETIIAPWVQVPSEFEHGEGCVIANYMFKNNSKFGDFVIMDSCICEAVKIGDYTTIGPFVNITSAAIGNDVYIGTHAAIIPGRRVGDNVTINPGSIVMNNLRDGVHVAGIPASRNLKKWEVMKNE